MCGLLYWALNTTQGEKNVMRKATTVVVTSLLMLCCSLFASAQSQFPVHQYWASDYSAWSIAGNGLNNFVFPWSACRFSAPGTLTLSPLATNAPVAIIDTTSSPNNEIVTPSAVAMNNSACSFTASASNSHYNFLVISGTAGLQEALNAIGSSGNISSTVFLDALWYARVSQLPTGNAASILAAAAGNAKTSIVDETTVPFTTYLWNGTKYVAASGVTGGAALPTVAATAGAGTAPTIAAFGNGSTALVNLTAGTSTATGSIFTLTYANSGASSGSFPYAPVCTIVNVGSTVPAGTLSVASTYSSSHAVVTASVATTALTASTAYQFRVSCQ